MQIQTTEANGLGFLQNHCADPSERTKTRGAPERTASTKPAACVMPPMPEGIKFAVEVIAKRDARDFDMSNFLEILLRHEELHKGLNEPLWTEKTEPWEVIAWMFKLYNSLISDNDTYWKILKWDKKPDEILIRHDYGDPGYIFGVPLYFLPDLQIARPKLFKIIFDTVSAMANHCTIGLWDEETDMFYEWFMEMASEIEDEEEAERYLDVIFAYGPDGSPDKWMRKIRKNKVTPRGFKQRVKKFEPVGELEETAKKWAEEACELLGHTIYDFIDDHDDESQQITQYDESMSPCRLCRFFWDVDDGMFEEYQNHVSESTGNFGVWPFREYKILSATNGETGDLNLSRWPNKLLNFLEHGNSLAERITRAPKLGVILDGHI